MILRRTSSPLPSRVQQAMALAGQMQFQHSCLPEVGRLLRVLASQVRRGVIGEIGTGCGVGAAWIASGLQPGVSLVTVESDPARAAAGQALFADSPTVQVIHADWRTLLPHGPFAMLFADGGKAKSNEPETVLTALQIGGMIVLDDLTPEDRWPPEQRGKPDPVREFWLNDPRLNATEIMVSPAQAAILGTRVI